MTTDIHDRDTDRPPSARAKGYIEDPARPLIHGHAAVLLARAKSTTQGYLSRLSSVVRNQQAAGSCVANALEAAFLDRMLAQRTEKPRLGARLQTYLNARLYGLAHDNGISLAEVLARLTATPPTLTLEDGGCMIGDASQARFDLGVAPESVVPYSDALVLEATLQPEAYQQAHDQRGKGTTHACANSPENRRYDIMGAIDADFPVVVGIQVDQAFEDSPAGLWTFGGKSLGWHALEVIAYDTAGVWIRNSWADWGSAPPPIDASWIDDDGMPAQAPTRGFAHLAWDSVLGASAGEAFAVQWSASYSQDVPNALRIARGVQSQPGDRSGAGETTGQGERVQGRQRLVGEAHGDDLGLAARLGGLLGLHGHRCSHDPARRFGWMRQRSSMARSITRAVRSLSLCGTLHRIEADGPLGVIAAH